MATADPAEAMPLRETLRCMTGVILTASERRRGGLIIGLVLGAAVLETAGIGAVLPVMQLLLQPEFSSHPVALRFQQWLGVGQAADLVSYALLALLVLFLAKNAYVSVVYLLQARYVSGIEARLGTALIASYLGSPYSDRLSRHSADRIRVVTTEVGRATGGFLMPALALATELAVVAGIVAMLVLLRPAAALTVLAVVGAGALFAQRLLNARLFRLREIRLSSYAALCKVPTEALQSLKEVQAMARESYFVERFRSESLRYAHATALFTFIGLSPRLLIEAVALLVLAAAVAWSQHAGHSPSELLPSLTLFAVAAVRLMPSAARLVSSLASLRFHAPSVDEVAQGLRAGEARLAPAADANVERIESISLEGVGFRYPGADRDALSGVSLSMARGELLVLMGPSGAGKSTLADLLLGLLEPTAGRCLVNGQAVSSLAARLRGRTGLVPQNFYILDDSVRRNVAFGEPESSIDDARVREALRLARLDERVSRLSSGIDTPLGENAGLLSGGERQRLAVARALYHDPDILILDEATSALDTQTEEALLAMLKDLSRTRTVLLVTHRERALAYCDRLIRMDAGRVSASVAHS